MNKNRREALTRLAGQLDDIKGELEALKEEEQNYHDNMPEAMQGGEKGEKAEAAIGALDDAVSSLDEAISKIEEASE